MNLLERHFCDEVGEDPDNPDVFIDGSESLALLRGSLNDAIEEIAMITGSVKRTYHLPLRANRGFHRLPSIQGVLGWITDAWIMGNGRRLEQVGFNWLKGYNPRWLENTGTPERYCLIGTGVIGIHPSPSSATDMLEITAAIIPGRYETDTERIQVRDDFKWATVHYAVSEYYASRGDANSATKAIMKYIDRTGLAKLYPETADRQWGQSTDKWNGPKEKAV